ncbi:PH domain-containing protein [Corynebacterium casei]|uniref:PH domain-containing protein n=1 Tax=Corynebacterium casei TaxID=160386 RepID=UPI003F8E8777
MTDPVPADSPADNADNTSATLGAAETIPAPTGKIKDFVPERTHVFALAMMAMVCIIMAGWNPLLIGWTTLIPLIWIYWVLRAKTTVGDEGIAIRYAFRGAKSISWDEFEGVGFKGSKSFAATKSGEKHMLPGVTFNSLPGLFDASRGRIPDALSEGKAAADEKVVIVHRDGQQILMSKDEFAQYKAANETDDVSHRGQNSSPRETPPETPRTQIRGRDGVE